MLSIMSANAAKQLNSYNKIQQYMYIYKNTYVFNEENVYVYERKRRHVYV